MCSILDHAAAEWLPDLSGSRPAPSRWAGDVNNRLMARKRKSAADTATSRPTKKQKPASGSVHLQKNTSDVHHAVLSAFYPRVCTLRNYLLGCLPVTSRVRRRKLTLFGKDDTASVLDTCLVGVLKQPSLSVKESRRLDFASFTQSQHRATGANTGRAQPCCIDEVANFPPPTSSAQRAILTACTRSLTLSSGHCSKPTSQRAVGLITFFAMASSEVQLMERIVEGYRHFYLASSGGILMTI